LRDTVGNLLGRSFPNPGDDVKVTAMFDKHVDEGSLGIPPAMRDGAEIRYAYPVAILEPCWLPHWRHQRLPPMVQRSPTPLSRSTP
jgi:hypothetical protein